MDQAGPLHAFGEGDHVLRADHIRAQRALQGRIERYVTGRIDNDVDVVGDLLGLFIAEAKIVVRDVAAYDLDFVPDESVERAAISLAQRIERGAYPDVLPAFGEVHAFLAVSEATAPG